MKKVVTLVVVVAALLFVALAFAMWPRTPRGEHQSERGKIYYFSDGVVAIDTTRSPHEFYIYANHPDDKKIEKLEIIDDGIHITGPGIAAGADEFTGAKMSVGYTQPPQPGKVRVFENHGEWSEGRHIDIAPDAIQDFVERGDWDASVRELWKR